MSGSRSGPAGDAPVAVQGYAYNLSGSIVDQWAVATRQPSGGFSVQGTVSTPAVDSTTPEPATAMLLVPGLLILIVTIKYVVILLRADNNGEGGTLARMALAHRAVGARGGGIVILLGIISGALFYGDAIITPALSVLSAVEGLKVATPAFEHYVVPLTVVILVALFAVQSRGTARVATFFGPVTLVWFIAIAIAGLWHVAQNLAVLYAFNPIYGVEFLASHGLIGLITLGAVFLVVTGSEALYADLGHFGRRPIQAAWLFVALPALILNYLGQGALILADPKNIENPFRDPEDVVLGLTQAVLHRPHARAIIDSILFGNHLTTG